MPLANFSKPSKKFEPCSCQPEVWMTQDMKDEGHHGHFTAGHLEVQVVKTDHNDSFCCMSPVRGTHGSRAQIQRRKPDRFFAAVMTWFVGDDLGRVDVCLFV